MATEAELVWATRLGILSVLGGFMAGANAENGEIDLQLDRSRWAEALSKIDRVTFTRAHSLSQIRNLPHLCFRFEDPTREALLTPIVLSHSGELRWFVVSDFPNTCIFAQSKEPISPTYVPTGRDVASMKATAEGDARKLISELVARLTLGNAPGRGYEVSDRPDDEPDDFFEPAKYSIFLVADPQAFSVSYRATSRRDYQPHFGLSDDELADLLTVGGISASVHDRRVLNRLSMLAQSAPVRYEPSQLGHLVEDLRSIEDRKPNPNVRRVLGKLLTAVGIAQKRKLGMVIQE